MTISEPGWSWPPRRPAEGGLEPPLLYLLKEFVQHQRDFQKGMDILHSIYSMKAWAWQARLRCMCAGFDGGDTRRAVYAKSVPWE